MQGFMVAFDSALGYVKAKATAVVSLVKAHPVATVITVVNVGGMIRANHNARKLYPGELFSIAWRTIAWPYTLWETDIKDGITYLKSRKATTPAASIPAASIPAVEVLTVEAMAAELNALNTQPTNEPEANALFEARKAIAVKYSASAEIMLEIEQMHEADLAKFRPALTTEAGKLSDSKFGENKETKKPVEEKKRENEVIEENDSTSHSSIPPQ
jgi:hypothetical protein